MRKLRLLPEVLPDPTAKAAEGSPRARTVRHMQRLLAMAAATTALACTKEGEPGIRKENEATTKKKPTADPTATETATATATASTTAEPDPTVGPGYGVVDPMPPPAKCAGAAASIKAVGAWKTDKLGAYVELKLPKPTMPDTKYDRKAAPYASGGKIGAPTYVGDDLVLHVVPDAGSTTVWVYASVTCTAGPEHVSLQVDLSAGTAPGSAVKISMYDQY
ncbi:MAG: hypothetical protein ABI175_26020 [Polyangiales bacterium]